MAHQPKPFFRTGRGWFVQLGKQQIKLAPGPENPETEKAAWTAFHALMVDRNAPISANTATRPDFTVGQVFEKFLDWSALSATFCV